MYNTALSLSVSGLSARRHCSQLAKHSVMIDQFATISLINAYLYSLTQSFARNQQTETFG